MNQLARSVSVWKRDWNSPIRCAQAGPGVGREARGEAVVVVGVRHLRCRSGRAAPRAARGCRRRSASRCAAGASRPRSSSAPPRVPARRRASAGRVAEVGEHDLLEVDLVLLPAACRRRGRWRARAASSAARCGSRGSRRGRARRWPRRCAARSAGGGSRRSRDRAGQLRAAGGERHQVVAHALELGHDVRREDTVTPPSATASRTPFRNSRRASGSSEATGSSSTQQPRLLGERERQRDLRLLAAGELADLLRRAAGRAARPARARAARPSAG